jgi:hypothetical protein
MASSPNTLALACVEAAGAARRYGEGFTVVRYEGTCNFDEFLVYSSQQIAVLKENKQLDDLTPLASFLPNGSMELYPAGAALPFFTTRIDTDDVHSVPN